jgi:hypothetical protein
MFVSRVANSAVAITQCTKSDWQDPITAKQILLLRTHEWKGITDDHENIQKRQNKEGKAHGEEYRFHFRILAEDSLGLLQLLAASLRPDKRGMPDQMDD